MKFIVVLLFALNVFLLSWWTGWIKPWDNREPERLRKQVDAERISIQSQASLVPPAAKATPDSTMSGSTPSTAAPAGTTASPLTDGSADKTGTSAALPGAASAPGNVCVEFPAMETDKAQAIEASMKQAGLSVETSAQASPSSFMVMLPPSESNKEAQRKLAELKRLGITDAYLMQDGQYKLGISLGVFHSEEGAKSLIQQLIARGIRSARIAPSGAARAAKTVLKATGTDAQLTKVRQAASEVNLTLKACGG